MVNNKLILYTNTPEYLGIPLDTKLKWDEHVKIEKEELKIRLWK